MYGRLGFEQVLSHSNYHNTQEDFKEYQHLTLSKLIESIEFQMS